MTTDIEPHPFDNPDRARQWVQALDTASVVYELASIGRELEALSHKVREQDAIVVQAQGEWRRAYASSFLTSTGPVKEREQRAVLESETEKMEAETAQQVLRAMRDRVRILGQRLDIGRSINAAVRSQFAAEAVGQHT